MRKRVLHEPRGAVKLNPSLRCDSRFTFPLEPAGVKQTSIYHSCETGRLCDNGKPGIVRKGKAMALIQSDTKEGKPES